MPELFFVEHKSLFVIIHAFSAAIGVGATLTTDFLFFQFLRDYRVSRMESSLFRAVSRLFPIFLSIIILSGIAIYFSDPAKYMQSAKFITKMVAVFVILINGTILHHYVSPRLQRLDFTNRKFTRAKKIAFACGAISIASWVSSYLLGSVSSIPMSATMGILLYGGIILCGIGISQLLYHHTQAQGQK